MFAVVMKVSIDPAQAPEAAVVFTTQILPQITSLEGFRAGHWLEPSGGEGLAMVLFETEQQARRMAQLAIEGSAPGVTILGTDVRRVAVSIS